MTKRKAKLRDEVITFLKQYERVRHPRHDPNDRRYDREVEKRVKNMDPEELDAILRGEDDEEND
jgi:hypothetical protein